jgi:hypothetical protein
MNIPKYWANRSQRVQPPHGRALRLESWQWSDLSVDDAQRKADDRLRAMTAKALAGNDLDRYGYGTRPLREEIVQPLAGPAGREIAVVTRNLYGALILNTANAMFIDIDFPENDASASPGAPLRRMFRGTAPDQLQQALQRIEAWAGLHSDLGIRIYRTFAGLRGLVTNQSFEPGHADAINILQSLGSDRLYIQLCQAQTCFRARLTPKPWRCQMDTPPSRYPWLEPTGELQYRIWQHLYEQSITGYSVCQFIKQIGPSAVDPAIEPILALHDHVTGLARALPLA